MLVISSPWVMCSPNELASPEQTATGKDISNPFIVSGLLINQMVTKRTIASKLNLLASPEQTATGKDSSNPFIVSGLLINQMVFRCTIVFGLKHLALSIVLASVGSFDAAKIWCFSLWCFSWILDSWFFAFAGWKMDVHWMRDSSWFYS